jgi:hypothetical protein
VAATRRSVPNFAIEHLSHASIPQERLILACIVILEGLKGNVRFGCDESENNT